ncbi:hypothetical protein TNCV_3703801, partial [Trichonephila clavipes]
MNSYFELQSSDKSASELEPLNKLSHPVNGRIMSLNRFNGFLIGYRPDNRRPREKQNSAHVLEILTEIRG